MKMGQKIFKIISVDSESYKIKLKFKNGDSGTVDLSDLFNNPKNLILEILKGQMFDQCFIESGALAWPNGLELCPDFLFSKLSCPAKPLRKAS